MEIVGNCWLKTTDKLEELLFVHSEVVLKSWLVFYQYLLYYLVKCSTFIQDLVQTVLFLLASISSSANSKAKTNFRFRRQSSCAIFVYQQSGAQKPGTELLQRKSTSVSYPKLYAIATCCSKKLIGVTYIANRWRKSSLQIAQCNITLTLEENVNIETAHFHFAIYKITLDIQSTKNG